MTELLVNVNDIQKTLAPVFGVGDVRIIIKNNEAIIRGNKPLKVLRAKGIFNDVANTKPISGEKGAWERAVVEKYAENYCP
jgi:hypothetical protein